MGLFILQLIISVIVCQVMLGVYYLVKKCLQKSKKTAESNPKPTFKNSKYHTPKKPSQINTQEFQNVGAQDNCNAFSMNKDQMYVPHETIETVQPSSHTGIFFSLKIKKQTGFLIRTQRKILSKLSDIVWTIADGLQETVMESP